jgi:glucose-6-phosphate-specific signal transduction histidine kinase
LPSFALHEWQRIGAAINQLAASRQQLLDERQALIVKLLSLQEDERRMLVRELHDEWGQCLAAINAVASGIRQTAAGQCPQLVDEADHISRITGHMLQSLRGLLGQLRPAEWDELGLQASLGSLVAGWNARCGSTRFRLAIVGACEPLAEAQAIALFRIAQEALTNIAKHARASEVEVALHIAANSVTLKIVDDGVAQNLPFAGNFGIGLLGIRERVTAWAGELKLAIVQPHGLALEVTLPVNHNSMASA